MVLWNCVLHLLFLAFLLNQWKTQQRETSIYWWSYYVASTYNQFFRIYTEEVRFWVKFYLVVRKVELLVRLWEKCQNSESHCETVRVGNHAFNGCGHMGVVMSVISLGVFSCGCGYLILGTLFFSFLTWSSCSNNMNTGGTGSTHTTHSTMSLRE